MHTRHCKADPEAGAFVLSGTVEECACVCVWVCFGLFFNSCYVSFNFRLLFITKDTMCGKQYREGGPAV